MAEESRSENAGVKPIRGKPKSGRVWKDERKPVHTLIKKTKTKNAIWKKRMQDKVDALTTKVGIISAAALNRWCSEAWTGTAPRAKRRKDGRTKAIGRKEEGGRGKRTETGTFPRTNRHRSEKNQKARSARDSTKTKTGAKKEKNAKLNDAVSVIDCHFLSLAAMWNSLSDVFEKVYLRPRVFRSLWTVFSAKECELSWPAGRWCRATKLGDSRIASKASLFSPNIPDGTDTSVRFDNLWWNLFYTPFGCQ